MRWRQTEDLGRENRGGAGLRVKNGGTSGEPKTLMGGNRSPHSSIPSTSGKECQGLAMSFRDSAGDSKYRGHFSSTALWLLLPRVCQSPLPPLGLSLRALAPGRQPLAIASGDPGREQAWVGVSGVSVQWQMPQV